MRRFLYFSLLVVVYFTQEKKSFSFEKLPQDSIKMSSYYFVSNRNTESEGTYSMYKARKNESGISSTIIRGNFEIKGFPNMRKAEISIYNISNDENWLEFTIPTQKLEII